MGVNGQQITDFVSKKFIYYLAIENFLTNDICFNNSAVTRSVFYHQLHTKISLNVHF